MGTALTAAGWVGGFLMMVAYGLVTLRYLSATGLLFQCTNIVGAVLLAGSAIDAGALPNAVISVVWAAVGVYALVANKGQSDAVANEAPRKHSPGSPESANLHDRSDYACVEGTSTGR